MNILVIGSKGFIGRNLIEKLKYSNEIRILEYDKDKEPSILRSYSAKCDFLYHLAAVHRPQDQSEFKKVNHLLFAHILGLLRTAENDCPVLLPSSIQAGDGSLYGTSKLEAERELRKHAAQINSRAIIYRLTNTFGRWAEPHHHSVVATFCHSIARGLPIVISDPEKVMHFYYIDDVIASFVAHLERFIKPDSDGFYRLPDHLKYSVTLGDVAAKIYDFKQSLENKSEPECPDLFTKKLYQTYKSYL